MSSPTRTVPRANLRDRSSIERIYPRAVFARDANANSRAKVSVLSGVHISSAPDEAAEFDLARASRHVGEESSSGGAVFLCPFAQEAAGDGHGDYPAQAQSSATAGPKRSDYDAFIDRIIETARNAQFGPSPGPGDARLQGQRQ